MANFLYSQVTPELQENIEVRKQKNARQVRASRPGEQDFHHWNTTKAVYASIHSLKEIPNEDYIKLSSEDYKTVKRTLGLGGTEKSSYIIETIDMPFNLELKELYDPEDRLVPRHPALTSISIDNQQRLGAVRVAEVRFTVFSRKQHNYYANLFLKLRRKVVVEWGWSNYQDQSEILNNDIFLGVVYNFSHQLRPDGGSECIIYLIQPGATVLQTKVKNRFQILSTDEKAVLTDTNNVPYIPENVFKFMIEDAAAISEYLESGIANDNEIYLVSLLQHQSTSLDVDVRGITRNFQITPTEYSSVSINISGEYPRVTSFFIDSVGNIKLKDYQKIFVSKTIRIKKNKRLPDQGTRTYYRSYISLYKLVELVNKKILGGGLTKVELNKEKSTGLYNPELFSCDPESILFPDKNNSTYRVDLSSLELTPEQQEELDNIKVLGRSFFEENNDIPFKLSDYDVDLGWIYISNEFLSNVYASLFTINNPVSLPEDEKRDLLVKFFDKIFNRISDASAGVYELSLVPDPDTPTTLVIYDTNHTTLTETTSLTKDVDDIKPLVIPAIGSDSIARHITLTSQVTGRIASSVYATSLGFPTKRAAMVGALIGEKEQVRVKGNVIQKRHQYLLTNVKPTALLFAIYPFINLGSDFPQGRELASQYLEQLMFSDKTVREGIYLPKNRERIKSGLELFPLNLSVTIDGIAGGGPKTKGFKFGNVISTDWLPFYYYTTTDINDPKRDRLHFIVTRITHNIRPNDWTTTLDTVCRILTHRWFEADPELQEIEDIELVGSRVNPQVDVELDKAEKEFTQDATTVPADVLNRDVNTQLIEGYVKTVEYQRVLDEVYGE